MFSVRAPQLSGCIFFAHPDARAIFLLKDLPFTDTCSVSGERNVLGKGTNGKEPKNHFLNFLFHISPGKYGKDSLKTKEHKQDLARQMTSTNFPESS